MKKYVIVGTGGTGGAIGGYLAKAGKDVTFIARGDNLEAMKEKGLRIIRPKDEFVIDPVKVCELKDYKDKADVIFVCVKGYSLDSIIPDLKRIADEDTIIIPILNIFGTGGRLQEHFPETLVTDGCIYVASQIKEPGCIQMNGDILRVVFGVRDESDYREELKEIEEDLNASGIEGILSDNTARDALLKFSYVSPQGACGLYYDVPAGDIQKKGEIRDCFIELVSEVCSIGIAMGLEFGPDVVDRNLAILDSLAAPTTTSLQRDIMAGRQSEVDGLIYEVVRLGEKYGVQVPMYKEVAQMLKEKGL